MNLGGAAISLILAMFLAGAVFAQNQIPQFKVGDRVEVDTLYSMNPEKSPFWSNGTIVKTDDPKEHFGSYTIKLDKDGHMMTLRFIDTQWIRLLKETNAGSADKNKAGDGLGGGQTTFENKTEKQPTQPAAGITSCSPSDESGGKTQGDIFKRLIRERYEHKPEKDRDKTATVTFQSFKLGTAHKWRPGVGGESPDGPGGNAGTTIYPVKAVYTVCEDYPGFKPTGYTGEIQTRQDDNTFYCFKDQFGEWVCNLGEGKTGKITFITK
jgi:hypothetical protein